MGRKNTSTVLNKKMLKQSILNSIMVNGSKRTSEKIFLKSMKLVQIVEPQKSFETILKLAVLNSSPAIYIKKIRRKRKRTVEFPFLLKPQLRVSYGIKFIIRYSKKSSIAPFFKSLNTELLNSSKKVSSSFKAKTSLYKEAFLKKKFANYRWF